MVWGLRVPFNVPIIKMDGWHWFFWSEMNHPMDIGCFFLFFFGLNSLSNRPNWGLILRADIVKVETRTRWSQMAFQNFINDKTAMWKLLIWIYMVTSLFFFFGRDIVTNQPLMVLVTHRYIESFCYGFLPKEAAAFYYFQVVSLEKSKHSNVM